MSVTWTEVEAVYEDYQRLQKEVDSILSSLGPEVEDLVATLRAEERANLELRVAQARKISPQDVTEEAILSYAELLSEQDSSIRRIARANAKKKGRPLLQKLHPDKGGDPVVFDIARKAILRGDIDLVQILLYRLRLATENPALVRDRVLAKKTQLLGSQVYGIARSFVSMPREVVVRQLRALLEHRISILKLMNIPGAEQ
jgi:hypothetical protein